MCEAFCGATAAPCKAIGRRQALSQGVSNKSAAAATVAWGFALQGQLVICTTQSALHTCTSHMHSLLLFVSLSLLRDVASNACLADYMVVIL
jgi:hypothetical protein